MVSGYLAATAVFLIGQRVCELFIARRNSRWSLAQGAVEFGASHYRLFFALHGAWFAGWITEGLIGQQVSSVWVLWLAIFAAAQALRYWCISSLGYQWNTRILVIPGAAIIRRGPYRLLPHANYLAVAIELFCVPMLFNAVITATTATLLNAALLLLIRIPEEEKALSLLKQEET